MNLYFQEGQPLKRSTWHETWFFLIFYLEKLFKNFNKETIQVRVLNDSLVDNSTAARNYFRYIF